MQRLPWQLAAGVVGLSPDDQARRSLHYVRQAHKNRRHSNAENGTQRTPACCRRSASRSCSLISISNDAAAAAATAGVASKSSGCAGCAACGWRTTAPAAAPAMLCCRASEPIGDSFRVLRAARRLATSLRRRWCRIRVMAEVRNRGAKGPTHLDLVDRSVQNGYFFGFGLPFNLQQVREFCKVCVDLT